MPTPESIEADRVAYRELHEARVDVRRAMARHDAAERAWRARLALVGKVDSVSLPSGIIG